MAEGDATVAGSLLPFITSRSVPGLKILLEELWPAVHAIHTRNVRRKWLAPKSSGKRLRGDSTASCTRMTRRRAKLGMLPKTTKT